MTALRLHGPVLRVARGMVVRQEIQDRPILALSETVVVLDEAIEILAWELPGAGARYAICCTEALIAQVVMVDPKEHV